MFRTELPLTPHPQQLPHSARVLTIGSCFSDSIGSRLRDFKVTTMVNPFGTVFNPISACRLLRAAAGEDMDWQQHVVEARGRWQSHDLHAEIGAETPVELLQHIQTLTREVGVFLATADAVVLTLGSAFAYRLRETDAVISNCHKLPAEKFEKELLTADDIIAAVAETHAYLRRINPRLRFILTVSPVRHIKDTLVLNSTSKSMLRVACHYLSELLPDVTYFPAYELLLDDLRDYRFYAADMLHPSEVAENYIWERFTRTYFDAAFGRFKKEWEGVRQALGHKPTYAAAPEHRQFLESTMERLHRLGSLADVRMEVLHLERELAALPLPTVVPEPEPEEVDDDEERIDIGEYAEEASTSQASLLGAGAGMLREDASEAVEDEADEQDEPAATPESAYEHAYTPGLEEEDEADEEETDAPTGEEPVRRKKRRSRGGAKRTKRKHARLAAEAAQETPEQATTSTQDGTAVAPEENESSASMAPGTTEPQSVLLPGTEADETAAEPAEAPRRSRNNRRNQRERPARNDNRNGRPALYATEEPVADETPTQAVAVDPMTSQQPAASEPVEATTIIQATQPEFQSPEPETAVPASTADVVESTAAMEPAAKITRAKRPTAPRSRKKAAVPASEPEAAQPVAETPAPEVSTAVQSEALPEIAPAASPEAVTPTAPKPRSRRKPAAKVAAVPTAEPAAETPADIATTVPQEASVVKPPRKRPSRKAPSTEPAALPAEAPAAEAPTDAPTETAAAASSPKRKPRPPRRKPTTDPAAPENS